MKKFLLTAVSLLLVLGSCQNDLEENVLSNGQKVVTATIENPNSRLAVSYNETSNVFNLSWNSGDAFKVFSNNTVPTVYNWISENDFLQDGDDPVNPKYAIYPVEGVTSVVDGVVTMTLNANPSVSNINLPMWAGAPANGNYAFKHLAAALQFTLKDIPTGYNQLIVEASEPISGTFTANLTDPDPELTSNSDVNEDKKVTVSFIADNTNKQNQVFYIPLPDDTYGSLKVSVGISGSNNTKELKSWTNLRVERGKMYYTTAVVDAATVDAANTVLASIGEVPTTVNLTAAIDASAGALDIPDEAKNVTMDFEVQPTTNETSPLIITQNETAPSGTATGELNIKMPNGATELYAEINTPTTTTTLSGGSYKKVTATTATSTLILDGVGVDYLYLNGGHVIIKDNAYVFNIANAEGFEGTTYVVNKNNSCIPMIADDATNVVLCSSESELALRVAVDNGGEVVLKEEVTIEEPLVVTKDLILDLGVYNLLAKKTAIILKNGTLTIRNGKICNPETYPTGNGNYYDAICIEGESDAAIAVNIESTVELNTRDCCVVVPKENESTNITITTAGELRPYGSCPAIQFNGNSKGCTLNVTGGEIIGNEDVAIYFPCAGNLNISGGTITANTAVYVKSGNLSITGGTLIGNGAKADYLYNGNGCNATGDALVIDNCNYPSGLGTLSISGGTFSSENAKAIGSYCGNNVTEVKTGFITGGTFSDALAFNYLGADANVTLGANATISDFITISNNATINLGGNNLTGTSKHIIKVAENVALEIENGTISNQVAGESRCIFTQGGEISLTLDAVTLETQGGTGSQPLTIGGNGTGISVSINNSTIEAGDNGYAITTYNPSNVTIESSTITGWCALNVKSANSSQGSAGSIFNIINSTLTGTNSSSNDDYATIEIEDSNIQVDVDAESALTAAVSENNNNNKQYIFRLGNSQSTSAIEDTQITCRSTNLTGAIFGLGTANQLGDADYFESNVVKLPYNVSLDGWEISEAIDGLVSIIGKETSN